MVWDSTLVSVVEGLREPERSAVLDPVRVAAVVATGLLDASADAAFDGLTDLAARLMDAPMAFLTLVDGERSFWLSCVGVDTDATGRQNAAEESFCQYVIADRQPCAVSDAAAHPRTRENPSVALLGVRAWAGYPVSDADGTVLGSFCVMDTVPRDWDGQQIDMLGVLARAAAAQIALVGAVASERAARADLDAAREDERVLEARLERLHAVARELVGVDSLDDLTDLIVDRALPVLGADGGAIIVCDERRNRMRLGISERLGDLAQVTYGDLPFDSPLPACHTARTGERLLLGSREAGLAFTSAMAQVYDALGRDAWLFTPLRVGSRLLGSLAVSWVEEREFSQEAVDLIDTFAAQCALALDRIASSEAQREAAQQVSHLAEALQRSLLISPPTASDLDIGVRYLPAVQAVQVGGDWYDSFETISGAILVSVGDVAGHDGNAAAGMVRVRSLVRGLAIDSADGPAALLTRLDRAMDKLHMGTLATAVLARIEPPPPGGAFQPADRVRWSNAGHLPPLLRHPDGTVEVLDSSPNLLLGLQPDTERDEHSTDLPAGSLLLLCTDGLVERRGESLTVGLERLAEALATAQSDDPERLCDQLIEKMSVSQAEDDVALLIVRVGHPR